MSNIICEIKSFRKFQDTVESKLSLMENAIVNSKSYSRFENANNGTSRFIENILEERISIIFQKRTEPKGCQCRIFNDITTIMITSITRGCHMTKGTANNYFFVISLYIRLSPARSHNQMKKSYLENWKLQVILVIVKLFARTDIFKLLSSNGNVNQMRVLVLPNSWKI